MTIVIPTGTAVGYFRVSGPGQAGERHVSLEVQENHYTEHLPWQPAGVEAHFYRHSVRSQG